MITIAVFVLVNIAVHIALYFYLKRKSEFEKEQRKVLNLLQKLNDIILSSLTEIEAVAQKVSDAVAFDLGFQVGVILLKDDRKKVLRRVAISRTERVAEAVNKLGFNFKGMETPYSSIDNIVVQVATDGRPRDAKFLYDVLKPHVSVDQAKYIQDVGDVAFSLIYPLLAGGKIIGVMIISLSKKDPAITEARKKIIGRVIEVVGIALYNAMLYQELRVAGRQLEDANVRLKNLDMLKDEFVSVASHELRTPMTAVRSYVWMALHRSDIPLSQKLQRYLYRTLISTERLINLVSDMLNLSRIESGKIEISPRAVDLAALVKDIVEDIQLKAVEKKLQILTLEQRLPPVFADPEKVQQVLLNLLGNALKFTFPGGIISISFFTDGKYVETAIKDNGQGISPQDMGKLFKKFGRLDNSYVSLSTSGGTGLGLYISRSLIELMRGRVWATSLGEGKGSTFSFSLPVASPDIIREAEKYHVKPHEGEAKALEPVAI